MKLVSVNVGLPREVASNDRTVTTGIFKGPVTGPVTLRFHNLDGDRQADLSVHGGPTKAVYVYATEHYDFWKEELGDGDLPWGSFGENFSVSGVAEDDVNIGDEFQVGTARVVVTEPRLPCSKLAFRFGRPEMVKRFLQSGRTGFYLGVVEEGVVQEGDSFQRVSAHPQGLTVADVISLHTSKNPDEVLLRKAVSVDALPDKWRDGFRRHLERPDG